ncbi:UBN2_3 domain-containing protein [Cephalotus follicularis]|uniref:UBN2_3 domain-containing protein n=1 Tax=Cephalotus follicularis TaxID=3775 RepID=A0A1Q3D246_CEPFO|nr:UBN2_3 domain-containing protein [Cephalotus follicularis]
MESAKHIWEAISRQYSQKNNYAQAYEICRESREMSQGGLSLAAYYSNLSHLWQQLDAYRTHRPSIPTELVTFQKDIEKERVYDFLAGLNPDYDKVRVQVLCKDPFPTLEEAYNLIQHEERHRNSMMPVVHPELSALAIMPQPPTTTSDLKPDPTNKNPVVCDYCGKSRHTRATCWKLHGRPFRGRGGHSTSGRPQAQMTETSASPHHPTIDSVVALSSEQILALQRMLSQQQLDTSTTQGPSVGSSHGASNLAQSLAHSSNSDWLLDSGASDHMTSSSKFFETYIPCSGKDTIRVANGSLSSISGKCSIHCTPSISSSSVLHVLTFVQIYPSIVLH